MEPGRLLSRFLRYVKVDTTADDTTDEYPSSNGQFELGRMLVGELKAMGIDDVVHNDRGIVIATNASIARRWQRREGGTTRRTK